MEIKSSIKKVVIGKDQLEQLVKYVDINLNLLNDIDEVLLLLKVLMMGITSDSNEFTDSDIGLIKLFYDNLKPIDAPSFDSVFEKISQ